MIGGRQRQGATVCRTCGRLVGVSDERCYNCGARNPSLWGWAPALRGLGADLGFVWLTLGSCLILYLLALVLDPAGIRNEGFLTLLSPSVDSMLRLGATGILPVWQGGRWWTLLSAGWLHWGILHVGFNLYWLRILAPAVAKMYGPGRLVLIYTLASVAGFAATVGIPVLVLEVVPALFPLVRFVGFAGFTAGASAALMGLLGAMIHYGRRGGQSQVSRWAWGYALLFIVFGFVIGGVDNWAHLGGFAGGWLAARILDPLKPETLNHLIAALICVLLVAASIAASFLIPVPPLG